MSEHWRVLITGPATGLEDWVRAATEAGWEALGLPLLAVEPREGPLLDEGSPLPDWIAITSSNALPALERAAGEHAGLRAVRLAAVGDASAERALAAGLNPVLVPQSPASGAAGLAAALLAETAEGERILWPRGARARDLAEPLVAAGRIVDERVVYATVPAELPAELPAADAVFFASPSAVERWCEAAPAYRPAAIAIGWTTFDSLLESARHFSTTLPLSEPSTAALRMALESFFPSR